MVMYIVPGSDINAHKPRFSEDGGEADRRLAMEPFLRSPTPTGQPHPMPGTTIRPDHPVNPFRKASVWPEPESRKPPAAEVDWETERWKVFMGSPWWLLGGCKT